MSFGMAATALGAAASVKSLTSKSGGGGGSTASKDPWGEVVPWLKNNIAKGEQLQNAYEAQPFNALQQTAYQNAFGDIDNYRQNLMPALMQQAAGLLGPNFKLPASYTAAGMQAGAPQGFMTVGQGQSARQPLTPEQQAVAAQFIQSNVENPALVRREAARLGLSNADILGAAQTVDPGYTMGQIDNYMGRRDPQYAKSAFGLIDWNTVTPQVVAASAQAQQRANETPEQRRLREEEEYLRNSGMYYQGSGAAGTGAGGGGAPGGAPGTGGSPGDSSGW